MLKFTNIAFINKLYQLLNLFNVHIGKLNFVMERAAKIVNELMK